MGFAAPHHVVLLLPLLALGACGDTSPGNASAGARAAEADKVYSPMEAVFRPDGTIDRALYRRNSVIACRRGMNAAGPPLPPADTIDRYCTCLADRLVGTRSDHELRVSLSDEPRDRPEQDRIMEQADEECGRPPVAVE
jgi:hypothetical protein